MSEYEYIAYHGTSSDSVDSIKENNFKPSYSDDEWLGFGVYFFTEGAFCHLSNAREWAKNKAWDNDLRQHTYTQYSILEVLVSGDRSLDLRLDEDLKIFESVREHILKRFVHEKKNFKSKLTPDTFLCNAVSKSMKIDILIQNLYIKTKEQRINRINSRIPNSTVLCAKETAIIDIENINETEKGEINDE